MSMVMDPETISLLPEAEWYNNWGTSMDYGELRGVGGFEY
jgi:hypothetical protein